MSELFLLLLLFFAILMTYGLTKIALLYALKKGLIDSPGCRTSHQNDTPRGGGVSIVVTFLLFVVAMIWWSSGKSINNIYVSIVVGGAIVSVLGFWDDHRHIPAKWRFSVQLIAASVSLLLLSELPAISFFSMQISLFLLALPFYAMVLVWLLNLYNFMDGIDGIASVQAITVSAGAALILVLNGEHEIAYLLLFLSASVSGFLLWNWPPAKVFMGDACSGFLGFVLGLIAISTSLGAAINIWSWLILFAVFVVDATYTLIRRVLQGEKWYEAHRSHAYQILSRRYKSHKKITLGIIIINVVWLLPLAYLASIYEYWAPVLTLIALFPMMIVDYRVEAGVFND